MLALLAALCFILALFKVAVPFSLVTLGLALLAVHLAWPIAIPDDVGGSGQRSSSLER